MCPACTFLICAAPFAALDWRCSYSELNLKLCIISSAVHHLLGNYFSWMFTFGKYCLGFSKFSCFHVECCDWSVASSTAFTFNVHSSRQFWNPLILMNYLSNRVTMNVNEMMYDRLSMFCYFSDIGSPWFLLQLLSKFGCPWFYGDLKSWTVSLHFAGMRRIWPTYWVTKGETNLISEEICCYCVTRTKCPAVIDITHDCSL